MAPRPHNSGHYTMDACEVSQFDLQVRAMARLPLRTPRLHSPTVMLNLLGDLWFDASGAERTPPWDAVLALPGTHLHLYGKTSARPGRKMGHLNITAATSAEAERPGARGCGPAGPVTGLVSASPMLLDARQPEAIAAAAARLAAGELLALPTETVYGLGARADDDAAVAKIFAAKGPTGRPPADRACGRCGRC